jgi:hypothetical protein
MQPMREFRVCGSHSSDAYDVHAEGNLWARGLSRRSSYLHSDAILFFKAGLPLADTVSRG